MTRHIAWLAAALCVTFASPGRAHAQQDPRTYLYDVSAHVLPEQSNEFGLFTLRWSRTIAPGLQLTSHLASLIALSPSFYVKWRFVDLPSLALAVDGGVLWVLPALASSTGLTKLGLAGQVPVALRATVPISPGSDLNFAWALDLTGGQLFTDTAGSGGLNTSVRFESTFVSTDANGAWMVQLKVPVFYRLGVSLDALAGSNAFPGITFDSVPAWSVVVGRDFVMPFNLGSLAQDLHVRAALGYRNRPGILFLESIGQVVAYVDIYAR